MYIVFDIGGTNLRIASSTDGKVLNQTLVFPTPQSYAEGLDLLNREIKKLADNQPVDFISGGLPGLLNEEKTVLVKSWHLEDWTSKPLAKDLENLFNASVKLENDTALGALGEANSGAGKGFERVIYISVGTGLGGAWVINGKLVSGKYNSEPGHQIIEISSKEELENLVSGTSLKKLYGPKLDGMTPFEVWASMTTTLAAGIYNAYLHWPSDIVILGGGVVMKSQPPVEKLKKEVAELLNFYPAAPEITVTQLGDEAGLYGALELLK